MSGLQKTVNLKFNTPLLATVVATATIHNPDHLTTYTVQLKKVRYRLSICVPGILTPLLNTVQRIHDHLLGHLFPPKLS